MLSRQTHGSLLHHIKGFTFGLCQRRKFSTTNILSGNRAIVYTNNGSPSEVLSSLTYPNLPPPLPNTVNVRFLLAPINPADVNVIEGVYPAKPDTADNLCVAAQGHKDLPVFVGGNEGLAEVSEVGHGVDGVRKHDWVIMTRPQSGTWMSSKNVRVEDVLKVPPGLNEVQAATLTVNPPTAYNMLHDYVELNEGEWIIQNGANSAVGQAVIQIAATRGIKTINLIRPRCGYRAYVIYDRPYADNRIRERVDALKEHLLDLGATCVATYDELCDKSFKGKVKQWTGGKVGLSLTYSPATDNSLRFQDIRLGLNCVSGRATAVMARLLGQDGHLVSYGAMSKEPLSLPTSLFIFKNLTCHGFWQSRWYARKTPEERQRLLETLTSLMTRGQLKAPEHEILTLEGTAWDDQITLKIRDTFSSLARGQFGKKILLKVECTL
ncbi:hypothetical protein BJ138DRAFT_508064 [Hygrophoropsis aurantiaca]|uniref:Uncharacterized protein n=1 Tax=Hygrophoropsis aurantiaca TaxID=72124 RepID=A0ACB8A2D7_9AGAM|nr:hypothetical protein BJ138DRAFT_508064 [Hygrophoropsis aurantiaca]